MEIHHEQQAMPTHLPRITVVTPSYNQGQFIGDTIESVLSQGYPNLEYLVIDGGSEDQSVDVIRQFADRIDYWISEPDHGQSHAIQKGLLRATGEVFNWINSDDRLAPGALRTIGEAFTDHDAVAGTTTTFGPTGTRDYVSRNIDAWSIVAESLGTRARWHQPGIWLRTEQLREIGGLDESLHYRFDMDMLARYLTRFPKVRYVNDTVAYFRIHPASKTSTAATAFRAEHYRVIEKARDANLFGDSGHDLEQVLATMQWQDRLKGILDDESSSRVARARQVMSESSRLPPAVRQRYTYKYLKRILLRGKRRT